VYDCFITSLLCIIRQYRRTEYCKGWTMVVPSEQTRVLLLRWIYIRAVGLDQPLHYDMNLLSGYNFEENVYTYRYKARLDKTTATWRRGRSYSCCFTLWCYCREFRLITRRLIAWYQIGHSSQKLVTKKCIILSRAIYVLWIMNWWPAQIRK